MRGGSSTRDFGPASREINDVMRFGLSTFSSRSLCQTDYIWRLHGAGSFYLDPSPNTNLQKKAQH